MPDACALPQAGATKIAALRRHARYPRLRWPPQDHLMTLPGPWVPERLNLTILAALCDIFDCTPADLIEPYVEASRSKARKVAGGTQPASPAPGELRPTRARIVPDNARPPRQ